MITNYPNGVSSFGAPIFPSPFSEGYSRTLFVGSNTAGYLTGDGTEYARPSPTMLAILKDGAVDDADRGTLIVVRRGHTESISAADYFALTAARKRITIRGEGNEVDRPTFTWTAAGSTWLLDTDSVVLDNLNLNLDPGTGTVNVAAPITISGNGCGIRNCKIRGGTDANSKVTVGITVTGSDCFLENVYYYGAVAATATTHVRLTGTSRFRVRDLYLDAATTAAAVGSVQSLTTGNTLMDWDRFFVANNLATSTAAVVGLAGDSGVVRNGLLRITANGTIATDQAAAWGTKGNVSFNNVNIVDNPGEVGVTLLPVSA